MLEVMYDIPSREDIADVTLNRAVIEGKTPANYPEKAGQGRGVGCSYPDLI